MTKGMNVCDVGDILWYAESIGYAWNHALDILRKAEYVAMYGPQCVCRDEITEEQVPNEDARKILLGYFDHEKVDEFQINPKGG